MANMSEMCAGESNAMQGKDGSSGAFGDTDERRTTLSLSLTVGDKRTLKLLAAKRNTTIAAIIHGWIGEHAGKVDE